MFPLGDEERGRMITPIVTFLLVAINVVVFLIELAQPNPEAFIMRWGATPAQITAGEAWITLITSMFLHGGWGHLLGNMVFLWVFGDNVEDAFGHVLYLVFYFVCGIVASLAHIFLSPDSNVPAVGASGAISGLLGAYILMFGSNRVRVLIGYFITTVPAYLMIGLWIVLQFINGFASIAETAETGGGGVAYAAHVGGFIAGLILTLVLRGFVRRPALARS
jgi:membrane associated rhomboid family serine protease